MRCLTQRMAQQGAERAEHRTANTNASFHPCIARLVFQQNECAHERNKYRRTDLEPKFFGYYKMAALVNEQEQNKTERELPTPDAGVDSNRKQHRSSRLENDRQEFERGQNEKLQLGEKLRDYHSCGSQWSQRLLSSSPKVLAVWTGNLGDLRLSIHQTNGSRISLNAAPR